MSLLTIVLAGVLLAIVVGWLAWLSISLSSLREDFRAGRDRLRVPTKELQRGTQQLDSLRDEFRLLVQRVLRLEDRVSQQAAASAPALSLTNKSDDASNSWPCTQSSHQASDDSVSGTPTSQSAVADRSEEIISAFNALAASFDQSTRDAFVARYKPDPCSFDGTFFRADGGDAFWVFETGIQGSVIVLPGGTVARDWDKFYRQMDGMRARDVLGQCFKISDGGRLRVQTPARGRSASGSITLTDQGELSGI